MSVFSDIEAVHPQTQILTRVKRRPLDEDEIDEFLSRNKRQIPGPRSSGGPGDYFKNVKCKVQKSWSTLKR